MADKALKKLIANNIDKFEPDLTFLGKDYAIKSGKIELDMLAKDRNNTPVIIELKSCTDGGLYSVLEQVGQYIYIFRSKCSEKFPEFNNGYNNPRIIILAEKRKESKAFIRLKTAIEFYAESVNIRLYSFSLSDDKKSIQTIKLESPENLCIAPYNHSKTKTKIQKSEESEKLLDELRGLFKQMQQMKEKHSPGKGDLELKIANKLNKYKEITKLTQKQIGDELGYSHQSISFYRRVRFLEDFLIYEIKRDVISAEAASGYVSRLNKQEQEKVHEYISIFMRRNTDEIAVNRDRLIIMAEAATENKDYEDIKSDLLSK